MVTISGFTHVGIRVTERQRSIKFYGKLGFEQVLESEDGKVVVLKNSYGVGGSLIVNANIQENENILMDIPEKSPGYTHAAGWLPGCHNRCAPGCKGYCQ